MHVNWQALDMHHRFGACAEHTLMCVSATNYLAMSTEAKGLE